MDYELIVLGAGPGGYAAAIRAAQLGLRVALIERDLVGGTCLNRGCVPTKALLHAAMQYAGIRQAQVWGIHAEEAHFDFAQMHAHKQEVVDMLRQGVEQLLQKNRVTCIVGEGQILDAHTVAVAKETYTAAHLLIATGSVPAVPHLPGSTLPGVVTSDDLLQAPRFFRRLLIIGGGVIGVEFASLYGALGCQVTIVEALDRVLPQMDREISQNLSMILKKRGVC
ncbi:MAG: FAD-dependent oxidoreductase, partial [Clostridia bacterium]